MPRKLMFLIAVLCALTVGVWIGLRFSPAYSGDGSAIYAGVGAYLAFLVGLWLGIQIESTTVADARSAKMRAIADAADANPEAMPSRLSLAADCPCSDYWTAPYCPIHGG